MTTTINPTSQYGRFRAVVTTEGGAQFEAFGISEQDAGYRARRRAAEACLSCGGALHSELRDHGARGQVVKLVCGCGVERVL